MGLAGPGGRWRPVAAGRSLSWRWCWRCCRSARCGWAALIGVVAAVPWALGLLPDRRRGRAYWRLSAAGLERIGPDGEVLASYERDRIDALAITTGDGILTVFHRFGAPRWGHRHGHGAPRRVRDGRRLGIPVHVLDGEATDLMDPRKTRRCASQGWTTTSRRGRAAPLCRAEATRPRSASWTRRPPSRGGPRPVRREPGEGAEARAARAPRRSGEAVGHAGTAAEPPPDRGAGRARHRPGPAPS